MKGLLAAGHHVTFISPFAESNPPANYTDIIIEGMFEEISGKTTKHIFFKIQSFTTPTHLQQKHLLSMLPKLHEWISSIIYC